MARPLKPLLSRAMIVDAALHLIDKGRPFTIPALGQHLGVHPSSLYHHVSGRQEILELIREQLLMSGPWQDSVRDWAQKYRSSFAEHPHLVRLLTAQTVESLPVLQSYETLAQALRTAGFTPVQVQMAITVLDNFFLGSALDLAAPEEVWQTSQFPDSALAAAVRESPTGVERADAAFEFGLKALLIGLEALRGPA